MISKTEMLEAMDAVSYKLTEVLLTWVANEGNNLESFISNPSGHVNYNQYAIMDYGKLTERLNMLRDVENGLFAITEYKKGNEEYTRSMYESYTESIEIQLAERLLDWMEKRYADMTNLIISSGNAQEPAPVDDYAGMFSFNIDKYMEEYNMYKIAIEGMKIVIRYKKEQEELLNVETPEEDIEEQIPDEEHDGEELPIVPQKESEDNTTDNEEEEIVEKPVEDIQETIDNTGDTEDI